MKITDEISLALIATISGLLVKQILKKGKVIAPFFKPYFKLLPSLPEPPFYYYCRIATAIMPVLCYLQIDNMYSEAAELYKIVLVSISFIYNLVLFTAIGDDIFKRVNITKD